MSRFRLLLVASFAWLVLTACIPVTFPPNWGNSESVPVTYPVGNPADWFWMELPSAQLQTLLTNTGSYNVRGRVCFPASAWPRLYLAGTTSNGGSWYDLTTSHGCTYYTMMGTLVLIVNQYQFVSFGPQRLAGMGAGETFYIEMTLEANFNNQPVTIGVNAKVATSDQGTTWHTF